MNDFELLSIVLMILAIIVNLIIALLNEHNKNSHNNSLDVSGKKNRGYSASSSFSILML